jgi:hypothetical protein
VRLPRSRLQWYLGHGAPGRSGGFGGKWEQMDIDHAGARIVSGFSGSAVLDAETDRVIGMVVGQYDDTDDRGCETVPAW